MEMDHAAYMKRALDLAARAAERDEVPVGALCIGPGGLLLGEGANSNIERTDPTAHAEIVALREACNYAGNYRLKDATLYVTLEPCPMCYTAMVHARVGRLVYAAADPKTGYREFFDAAAKAKFNHAIEVEAGILAEEAAALIKAFFKSKRERGKRKWLRDRSG